MSTPENGENAENIILPDWAIEIRNVSERTRLSAYFYRREAVAFRYAMHEVLGKNKSSFAIYDKITNKANKMIEKMKTLDDKEEAAINAKVRSDIRRRVEKMICENRVKKNKKGTK